MDLKWVRRFLLRAKHVSRQSKDPRTRIGAVVTTPDRVVLSEGYNGFPRGFADTPERLNDRAFKHDHVAHAEENCVYNAARVGRSLLGSYMFVWGLPICHRCAIAAAQAGVSQVFMAVPTSLDDKWSESWAKSSTILAEAGVGASMFHMEDIKDED